MLKKAIAAAVCAAVAAVGVCFACLYKGRDEVTFLQRQYINQYLSSNPFEKSESGENIVIPVAVASGTDGYAPHTFLGVRNQLDYGTGYIEVKVAVTDSNEVVLADSYAAIADEPVALSRVINQMEIDGAQGLLVSLSEYSRLSAVNYVLTNTAYQSSCIITGVSENAVEYVASYFPKITVLCDYGTENVRSLESLKLAGADGVLVAADALSESLVKQAKELGLLVWVNCGSDVYCTVKAAAFSADGIVSSRPDFATGIYNEWDKYAFDLYFKVNAD